MKTALLCLVTCKLKGTGFMQTWTSLPHTVPDIAFSYGILGNVKPLINDVLFKAV